MKSKTKRKPTPPAAAILRQWCRDNGHTQVWVAGRLRISRNAVNKWCRGLTSPSLEMRMAVADFTCGTVPVTSWEVAK